MSTALESFLEEVDQERKLRAESESESEESSPTHVVKNDNSGGSSSGMIDMREMAVRYQEASDASVDAPIVDCTTRNRDTILFPLPKEEQESNLLLKIGIGVGAVVGLVVVTAVITATMMKPAVVAVEAPATVTQPALVMPVAAVVPVVERVELEPALVAEVPAVEVPAVEAPAVEAPIEEAPVVQAQVEEVPEVEKAEKVEKVEKLEKVARVQKPERVPVVVEPVAAEPVAAEPVEAALAEAEPAAEPVLVAAVEPVAEKSETCDEVLCLLEGKGCCGQSAKVEAPEPTIDTSLPEKLSRSEIAEGLRKYQGRLNTCGTKNELTGAVTLKLKIAADGSVTRVSAKTDNEAFASCIGILKSASFGETQQGTTVSYPIILR